jgi:hypothetical protein
MQHVYYLLDTGAVILYSKFLAISVVIQCGLRQPFPKATKKNRENLTQVAEIMWPESRKHELKRPHLDGPSQTEL